MKNNMISRIILCIFLLGFLYVSAACSVDNDKKSEKVVNKEKKVIEEDIDNTLLNAKKDAFIKEAEAYVYAADNENYKLSKDEIKTCYNLSDLTKGRSSYIGYVKRNNDGTWTIYITNNEFTIKGEKSPFNKSMIQTGNTLTKTTC